MRRFHVVVTDLDLADGEAGVVADFTVQAEHESMLFEPSIAAKLREPERSTHRVYFTRIQGATYDVTAADKREAVRIAQREASIHDGHPNLLLAHYEIEELP